MHMMMIYKLRFDDSLISARYFSFQSQTRIIQWDTIVIYLNCEKSENRRIMNQANCYKQRPHFKHPAQ